jgi:hypothetical protein
LHGGGRAIHFLLFDPAEPSLFFQSPTRREQGPRRRPGADRVATDVERLRYCRASSFEKSPHTGFGDKWWKYTLEQMLGSPALFEAVMDYLVENENVGFFFQS